MVSKKLATRLEKKREELEGMQAKILVLQKEVTALEQEARVELIDQLQKKLGTDDLLEVELFISEVKPVASEPNADMQPGQPNTHQGGGF